MLKKKLKKTEEIEQLLQKETTENEICLLFISCKV
jgi:hypothetical protein